MPFFFFYYFIHIEKISGILIDHLYYFSPIILNLYTHKKIKTPVAPFVVFLFLASKKQKKNYDCFFFYFLPFIIIYYQDSGFWTCDIIIVIVVICYIYIFYQPAA